MVLGSLRDRSWNICSGIPPLSPATPCTSNGDRRKVFRGSRACSVLWYVKLPSLIGEAEKRYITRCTQKKSSKVVDRTAIWFDGSHHGSPCSATPVTFHGSRHPITFKTRGQSVGVKTFLPDQIPLHSSQCCLHHGNDVRSYSSLHHGRRFTKSSGISNSLKKIVTTRSALLFKNWNETPRRTPIYINQIL